MMTEESRKILLAEDNVVNQKVVTLLLKQLGLTFDVVDSGQKAVQAVQKSVYSMILMDCQMPEMDGFEATKAIRKLESLRGTYTPIVAVTALAMVGDKERCIAAGMDDYMSKPIDRHMLKIKLDHWLQKDIVQKNQDLARKFAPQDSVANEDIPIDFNELKEFYGADMSDVLATYVENTDKLLVDISKAILDRKETQLAYMAHELKGSSASVGAKGIAKLGLFLERAVGINDWRDARDTFASLNLSWDKTKQFIKQEQQGSHEDVILPRTD
ncbi:MAG TPA: response regulator [Drouetiella sp.]